MKIRPSIALCAAFTLAAFAATPAFAAFSYSTGLTISSLSGLPGGDGAVIVNTPGVGSTVTITSATGSTVITLADESRSGFSVPGADSLNLGDINITTTEPNTSPGLTVAINYADAVSLTNNAPPGTTATNTGLLTGTLQLTAVNSGNGVLSNSFDSPASFNVAAGGTNFAATSPIFASPTINGTGGNFSALLTATVPEPASLGLLSLGALALLRRRRS